MSAALYIHIPFCEIRCGYCDFFTVTEHQAQIPAYLGALAREIELYCRDEAVRPLRFETLYLGGGTPSLLTPAQLSALLDVAFSRFTFVSNPEVTLEANPATLSLPALRRLRSAGINRLSLGLQSFQAAELGFLDRDHTVEQATTSFSDARQAGFENLSIDLIFALPEQSVRAWQTNLESAVALGPDHISAYTLTFENGTPLTALVRQGRIRPLPEQRQRRMQLAAIDYLQDQGFVHYEISNYARPGFESHHNQKYWDGSPYLGLGAAAHSYLGKKRFWNVRSLKGYLDSLSENKRPVAGDEVLDFDTLAFERVYLGLRQRAGIHLHDFEAETGTSLLKKYNKPLQKFFACDFDDRATQSALTKGQRTLKSRYLQIENGFLRLTRQGVLLCDAICAEFAQPE